MPSNGELHVKNSNKSEQAKIGANRLVQVPTNSNYVRRHIYLLFMISFEKLMRPSSRPLLSGHLIIFYIRNIYTSKVVTP